MLILLTNYRITSLLLPIQPIDMQTIKAKNLRKNPKVLSIGFTNTFLEVFSLKTVDS